MHVAPHRFCSLVLLSPAASAHNIHAGLPAPSYDPCASWRAWAYLNRDDVQEALNAVKVCGKTFCFPG
jgi:hypothetical protein